MGDTLTTMAGEGMGAALLIGLGSGLKWAVDAWLKTRRTPEEKAAAAAGLDAQNVKIAGDLMAGMRSDLDALRDEMRLMKSDHAAEISGIRKSHEECEQRCLALTGRANTLEQRVGSLLKTLKDPNATLPGGELAGAVIEISGGDVAVISTTETRKTS